ncbi:cell wall metabolism sensor histidine kinase WalK [Acidaminococcus timonensis]|uniref:sensor histidine kinase n=1 Tax=Acidaminococcus timonensis TaxID=1871002 RepID=UPI0025DDDD4C|nr:HAMP domain-containing sensor histidine kinase [Acidaminococcus timonensis]
MSSKCKERLTALGQLLQKLWHRLKNLPVSLRVTLWYTLFLSIILVVFTGVLLKMGEDYEKRASGRTLIKAVEKASERYEKENKKFKAFDDNVYLSLREHTGKLLQGTEPDGAPDLPINFNKGPQQVVINGESYHYIDHPLPPDLEDFRPGLGQKPPFVRGYLPDKAYTQHYRVLLVTALIVLPLFLILVTLGGYLIIKRSFAPVKAISQAARAIGETGDLSQRIPLDDSQDEIHQMGRTFNWMLEQIEELLEREKRFTSDVSHELRTPTAVIMSESEFGKDYTDNIEEAKDEFRHIFQQSRRMSRLINQLLELSRLGNRKHLDLQPVDLSRLVQETLEDYQKLPQAQKFQWKGHIAPGITVLGDEQVLHRILGNYLDNALKFTKTLLQVDLVQEGEQIRLTVTDDGPGIAKTDQAKIWDRLYQADPSRNKKQNMGLGLGLSFVAAAAKLMHARATVESEEGKGSTFGLVFKV